MLKYYKRGWGDRRDGWKLRNVDALFLVIPYIMRTRLDSQNLFEAEIDIEPIEEFIRKYKKDIPDLSIMHVVMAAAVRLFSQRPHLNRFVVWNKIYAHNSISFSLAVKRELSDTGEETMIKPEFEPEDTIYDVVKKVNALVVESSNNSNDVDAVAKIFGYFPPFIIRIAVKIIYGLDYIGILPKVIENVSPWHSSMFITNLGSIGIDAIYHHLYEFGTCSQFVAMGKKRRKKTFDENGEEKTVKTLQLKFVNDERICDGYYYAASMRYFKKILANPEVLLTPPKRVYVDEGVGKKRIDI